MGSRYQPNRAINLLFLPGVGLTIAGERRIGFIVFGAAFLVAIVVYYLQTSRSASWGLPFAVVTFAFVCVWLAFVITSDNWG